MYLNTCACFRDLISTLEDPNINPLSTPTMQASIFLLVVACTAFAAADSCTEGALRNLKKCSADAIEEYVSCSAPGFYNTDLTGKMDCIVESFWKYKIKYCDTSLSLEKIRECDLSTLQHSLPYCGAMDDYYYYFY